MARISDPGLTLSQQIRRQRAQSQQAVQFYDSYTRPDAQKFGTRRDSNLVRPQSSRRFVLPPVPYRGGRATPS